MVAHQGRTCLIGARQIDRDREADFADLSLDPRPDVLRFAELMPSFTASRSAMPWSSVLWTKVGHDQEAKTRKTTLQDYKFSSIQ